MIYYIDVPHVGAADKTSRIQVDPEIFARYCNAPWHLNRKGYTQRTANALERAHGIRGTVLLHRLVVGARKGECVDHINGDPLDCRRANLRKCTLAENSMNRGRLSKNNTSGERGVHLQNGGWVVSLRCRGKRYWRGTFTTFAEAVRVKRALEIDLYGEFGTARHLGYSGVAC
jgi:hypothetical protein